MAKDKAKPDAKPAEEAATKPKKTKLIILVVVAVLLLGGGGGAAWYFMAGSKKGGDSHQKQKKEDKQAPPVFVTLERFTVNLPSADGTDHFLMIAVDMKVTEQKGVETLKSHMPEIRNGVLLLLSSKTVEELVTLEGKKKLSADIVKQVNDPLHLKEGEHVATDALFTEFVIQ